MTVVVQLVSHVFGVPEADIRAAGRGSASACLARQATMYLLHVACRLSLTEVGAAFGRDRTTVAHACKVIEDRRSDQHTDRCLARIEAALGEISTARRQFERTFLWP